MSANKSFGLIQVYTGDGKGKTTAALGLALRAVGAGHRVCLVQFDKGGERYSERRAIAKYLGGAIDLFTVGLDRVDAETRRFRFGVTEADRREAEKGMALTLAALGGGKYELVILDELNTTVRLGLLPEAAVEMILGQKRPETELVVTGRHAPPALLKAADLVTECREIRHYFRRGIPARRGFDY